MMADTEELSELNQAASTFHDFLGMATDSPAMITSKLAAEASPSTGSASVGASSGGGRGPISTTSDLGSERRHFEGVPYYGPRSDLSGGDISNTLAGSKRSNCDSAYMGSSRDGTPHVRPDSLENSHLMKMLRSRAGGEHSRRSNNEDFFNGMQTPRTSNASRVLQTPTGSRPIPMNMRPVIQYPQHGQFSPSMHQMHAHKFREANVGPIIMSQAAADEGSRTGIKGSGILSSINASNEVPDGNSIKDLSLSGRPKSGAHILEPESTTAPSRHGVTSSSRQMTIFYGGQAHVFDEVHPNKADVIMALAGSNGGSWSTTYSPKSKTSPIGDSHTPNGENKMPPTSNIAFLRELRGRSSVIGQSSHGYSSGDRISAPTSNPLSSGNHHGGIVAKEARSAVQGAEPTINET